MLCYAMLPRAARPASPVKNTNGRVLSSKGTRVLWGRPVWLVAALAPAGALANLGGRQSRSTPGDALRGRRRLTRRQTTNGVESAAQRLSLTAAWKKKQASVLEASRARRSTTRRCRRCRGSWASARALDLRWPQRTNRPRGTAQPSTSHIYTRLKMAKSDVSCFPPTYIVEILCSFLGVSRRRRRALVGRRAALAACRAVFEPAS
jgi:hypothetical protein